LLRGGSLARLVLYLIAAWMGFGLGNLLATWSQWSVLRVGAINLLAALLAAGLSLVVVDLLVPGTTPGDERATADDEIVPIED
jgi:hypothetical protein